MKKNEKELFLLPRYYRIVGYTLAIITVLLNILSSLDILNLGGENSQNLLSTVLLLAFFLISSSKGKIEDELSLKIRLRAYASAFFIGVLFLIFKTISNLIFDNGCCNQYEAVDILNLMYINYFVQVYIIKKLYNEK